jgi:hypothetical protein
MEQELLTLPEHMRSLAVFIYFCCRYVISKKTKYGTGTAFHSRTPPGVLRITVP